MNKDSLMETLVLPANRRFIHIHTLSSIHMLYMTTLYIQCYSVGIIVSAYIIMYIVNNEVITVLSTMNT